MPLPLLPVVVVGDDVAAALLLVVVPRLAELLELVVAALEVSSAVVDPVEALPAYDAAAT